MDQGDIDYFAENEQYTSGVIGIAVIMQNTKKIKSFKECKRVENKDLHRYYE